MDKAKLRQPTLKSLTILIALLLCVIILSVWWYQRQQQHTLLTLQQLSQTTANTNAQLHAQIDTMQAQVNQLHSTLQSDIHWHIAEAAYFARLANVQLQINHDLNSAILLLTMASQALSYHTATPDITQLRQVVVANIAVLKQVKAAPILSLNQQLILLQQQVSQLTVNNVVNPAPEEPQTTNTKLEQKNWFSRLWRRFKDLVIIRKTDTSLIPLVSADAQGLMEQHILSLLIEAQHAALLGQNTLYQQNIQQTIWLAEHYYAINQTTTKNFVTNLRALQKINVSPMLPDLDPMLKLFAEAEQKA